MFNFLILFNDDQAAEARDRRLPQTDEEWFRMIMMAKWYIPDIRPTVGEFFLVRSFLHASVSVSMCQNFWKVQKYAN